MEMKKRETPKEVYDRFWKDIIEIDGAVDMEAVKAELSDFEFILEEVPKVYDELTHGRISKPNTYAFEVIREANKAFEDNEKEIALDDIEDMAKDSKTVEELMESIREYLAVD